MVRGEHHVGLLREQLDGLGEVMRPDVRVADQRTAQGQQVVQRVGGVLRHAQRPPAREVEVHLRRGLGARRHLEDHPNPVHGQLLAGGGDGHRRIDQRDLAGRGRLTQPGAHPAFRATGQSGTEHVPRAAAHRGPGKHILRDRVLHEPLGRDDLDLPGVHVLLGHDPLHPAEVIHVAVRVDHRHYGPVHAVLAVQR